MGLPARNDLSETVHDPQITPIPHPTEASAAPVALLPPATPVVAEYGRRAGEMLGAASRGISQTYARAWVRASDAGAEFAFRMRQFALRARLRAERVKEDRPLPVLGIIAGIAFTAGVAIRVWRSRER